MIIAKFYWLCVDCLYVTVSREAFDEARGPNAPPYRIRSVTRLREVENAVSHLEDGLIPDYSRRYHAHRTSIIFSKLACDCCKVETWGERYRFAYVADEQESARLVEDNREEDDMLWFDLEMTMWFDTDLCIMPFDEDPITTRYEGRSKSDVVPKPDATVEYPALARGSVGRDEDGRITVPYPTSRKKIINRYPGDPLTPTAVAPYHRIRSKPFIP